MILAASFGGMTTNCARFAVRRGERLGQIRPGVRLEVVQALQRRFVAAHQSVADRLEMVERGKGFDRRTRAAFNSSNLAFFSASFPGGNGKTRNG